METDELYESTMKRAIIGGVLLFLIFVCPMGTTIKMTSNYEYDTVYLFTWDALGQLDRMFEFQPAFALFMILFLFYPAIGGLLMPAALRMPSTMKAKGIAFFLVTTLGALGILGMLGMGIRFFSGITGGGGFWRLTLFILFVFSFIWANSIARLRMDEDENSVPQIAAGVVGLVLILLSVQPIMGGDSTLGGIAAKLLEHDATALLLFVPIVVGILSVASALLRGSPSKSILFVVILLASGLLCRFGKR